VSFWIAGISAVIALAGAAADAKQQREAGKANQQIAENNAKMAEAQAKDEAILGAREQQQSAWRTRAIIGQQKAAIAANNLDMDVGMPLDLLGDTALLGGADKSAISADAARKAWGFQGEALNYRNQGAQARWAGKVGAQTTILKGIGSAIGSFAGAGRAGGGFTKTQATKSATNISSQYFSFGGLGGLRY
jgi:hypothetical protein